MSDIDGNWDGRRGTGMNRGVSSRWLAHQDEERRARFLARCAEERVAYIRFRGAQGHVPDHQHVAGLFSDCESVVSMCSDMSSDDGENLNMSCFVSLSDFNI